MNVIVYFGTNAISELGDVFVDRDRKADWLELSDDFVSQCLAENGKPDEFGNLVGTGGAHCCAPLD